MVGDLVIIRFVSIFICGDINVARDNALQCRLSVKVPVEPAGRFHVNLGQSKDVLHEAWSEEEVSPGRCKALFYRASVILCPSWQESNLDESQDVLHDA